MKNKNHIPVFTNFTKDQHAELVEASERKGLKPSQFIRTSIVQILNRLKKQQP